jgi:Fe-S cluster assembly ATP-binding protein
MKNTLSIQGLCVSVDGKPIITDLNLDVAKGEVHALMGPNGSGKSTLANTLMGHPAYEVTGGTIMIGSKDITDMSPDKRSRLGLFLSFQYPQEVPGLAVSHFLRTAVNARRKKPLSVLAFRKLLHEKMELLGIDPVFARRALNHGFSGGEKKKMEMLQMAMLEPSFVVLDETDSGLDVDALKAVTSAIERLRGPGVGILLITHYNRILEHVVPDKVHVMRKGTIVKTGDKYLPRTIEEKGYAGV